MGGLDEEGMSSGLNSLSMAVSISLTRLDISSSSLWRAEGSYVLGERRERGHTVERRERAAVCGTGEDWG